MPLFVDAFAETIDLELEHADYVVTASPIADVVASPRFVVVRKHQNDKPYLAFFAFVKYLVEAFSDRL
jgi:hypothetical protein